MSQNPINIIKYSGEEAPFEESKLYQSLLDAGASEEGAGDIVEKIRAELFDGITTRELYKKAHRLLKIQARSKASRYGLKKAILSLGPTGYPFEAFIGEVMQHEGFATRVGTVMPGKCVTHEVDVYAENDHSVRMMECKFHNRPGFKTDVKVTLYIKSRFEDLAAVWKTDQAIQHKKHEGWVVTNARFTKDALDYGQCSGLHLLSWDYPAHGSLKYLVGKHALYPITTISSLSKATKEALMKDGLVLAKSLCSMPEALQKYGLDHHKIEKVLTEARMICNL